MERERRVGEEIGKRESLLEFYFYNKNTQEKINIEIMKNKQIQ